ncbi:MAG: lysophospholipid acyltransferase family protein [Gammaproteobacteria bacterium]|nr:lysophospholipid acyltransferase family protein [Gammaproteobacteria bacterium]
MYLRSLVFYVGYIGSTILWGSFATMVGVFLPLRVRFNFVIPPWTGFVIWWLKVTCGIKIEVTGREYLNRERPAILFFKHQSSWDALYSTLLTRPQVTIIKKQLLWIPFFGWAFWVTKPIAIDRKQKVSSMRQMIRASAERMKAGNWITIFPEGTRGQLGEVNPFQPGGAIIASTTKTDVIVVAHNGGYCWPRGKFKKSSGTINVHISPPISTTDKTYRELNEEAEAWMRNTMAEITPH